MSTFSHSAPTGGQFRAYADSYTDVVVTAPPDATADDVWNYCQTAFPPIQNRCREWRQFTGSCGFPFGLSAFAGVFKRDDKWLYRTIHPYCD